MERSGAIHARPCMPWHEAQAGVPGNARAEQRWDSNKDGCRVSPALAASPEGLGYLRQQPHVHQALESNVAIPIDLDPLQIVQRVVKGEILKGRATSLAFRCVRSAGGGGRKKQTRLANSGEVATKHFSPRPASRTRAVGARGPT